MLILITLATSGLWVRLSGNGSLPARIQTLSRVVICTTIVIYLQLGLGATMRHQHRDLSILDFPLAYGKIIPDTSPATLDKINAWRDARALSDVTPSHIWLQLSHRLVAVVIATGIIASLFLARRTGPDAGRLSRFTDGWFLLLACQITLGAWVIWSNKAADIATAHVAVGATMFGFGISLSAICLRLMRGREQSASPRQVPVSMESPVS
jgi:cytochrome c oxidase assembly protein subunit 15